MLESAAITTFGAGFVLYVFIVGAALIWGFFRNLV